jgi:hypothetical protein
MFTYLLTSDGMIFIEKLLNAVTSDFIRVASIGRWNNLIFLDFHIGFPETQLIASKAE